MCPILRNQFRSITPGSGCDDWRGCATGTRSTHNDSFEVVRASPPTTQSMFYPGNFRLYFSCLQWSILPSKDFARYSQTPSHMDPSYFPFSYNPLIHFSWLRHILKYSDWAFANAGERFCVTLKVATWSDVDHSQARYIISHPTISQSWWRGFMQACS